MFDALFEAADVSSFELLSVVKESDLIIWVVVYDCRFEREQGSFREAPNLAEPSERQ